MSIQSVLTNLVLRWQFKRGSRGPLNVADMRDGKDDSAGNRQRRFQWRVTERQHTDGVVAP